VRTGLAVSVTAHALLLAVGLITLAPSRHLEPPVVEAIAVDLVPIEEFSNIRVGALDSEVVETQTPSPVQSEEPPELARPAGNTQEDQPTPQDTPTPSPRPVENTAPAPEAPPTPEPQPTPEPEPEPAPQPEPEPEPTPQPPTPVTRPQPAPQPEPEPAPEPEPEPEPEPAPEPEPQPAPEPELEPEPQPEPEAPANVAPQPAMRTASLDQRRAEFARQEEQRRREEEERRRREQEERARAAAAAQQPNPTPTNTRPADDISAIINQETSRGGTTGQGGSPTLGDTTGTSASLSRSEIDGLIGQIKQCWSLLPGEIDSGLSVRLMVSLNQDGTVSGTPQVLEADSSPLGGSMARAAQRAVMQCGPYRLSSASYDQWRQIDVTLRP
jgi:hypothetical protein